MESLKNLNKLELLNIFLLISNVLTRNNLNNAEELTREERLLQVLLSYLENEIKEVQKQLYSESRSISQTEVPPMLFPTNSPPLSLVNFSLSILGLLLKC